MDTEALESLAKDIKALKSEVKALKKEVKEKDRQIQSLQDIEDNQTK